MKCVTAEFYVISAFFQEMQNAELNWKKES